jgi:hypothetical protein
VLEPPEERRPTTRLIWIIPALAAVAVGGVMLWLRRPAPPPVVAPAPPAPEAQVAPGAAPPVAAPPADADRVRSLLETVSTNALFRRWLAEGDVVRRWVVVTDNLAEGVSPRGQLRFLAPTRPFSVASRGGATVIAPESYKRYDAFAEAVASVDAAALARAYGELRPVLEAAYRALGYPDASLDRATARALQRIEAVPVKPGDIAVVEGKGTLFEFADPRLEGLGPVAKHLLRMGPRNAKLLQAKAKEIEQALGLPAAAAR